MGLCGTSSPQRLGRGHQEFDSQSFVPDPNVINFGGPTREKISSFKTRTIMSAFWSAIALANGHFEK